MDAIDIGKQGPPFIPLNLPDGRSENVELYGRKAALFLRLAQQAMGKDLPSGETEIDMEKASEAVDAILPEDLRGSLRLAEVMRVFRAAFRLVTDELREGGGADEKKQTNSAA